MGTVAFNSSDVLLSAANLYYAPKGTAIPDETTVAWNTFSGWHANWKHVGYTATPARLSFTFDTVGYQVEQANGNIIERKNNEVATIATDLAQFSGANLALILGGTNADVAAGASQKGFSTVKVGGSTNLLEYMFALEGFRPDATGTPQPVRVFIHRGTIRVNGDIQLAKATGTALPIIVSALPDSGKPVGEQLLEIHIVTSAATS